MATQNITRTPLQAASYLDDIIFPCSRLEVLRCAEDNEAPDAILDAIESLPDRIYRSVGDIVRWLASYPH